MAKDLYSQIAVCSTSLSAVADTLGYAAVTDAYKASDAKGWVVEEIRYHWEDSVLDQLNTDADRIKFGASVLIPNYSGGPEAADIGVLDWHMIRRHDIAALAADILRFEEGPYVVRDFTALIGGGYLVHPVNFYIWTYPDDALGGTAVLNVQVVYFEVDLSDALMKELWQAIYVRQV